MMRLRNWAFAKYYYLKLKWQYKGHKRNFQNYLEFMNKNYIDKMDFSDHEDGGAALKNRLDNTLKSIEFSKNYHTAVEDCRRASDFIPIPLAAKKSVSQSLAEAVKQCGGLGEWRS